jgi:CheY-like chemotaxis protein
MLQPWCVQLPIIVLMPGESGGPAQGPFGSKKDGTNLSLHLRVLIAEDEGLVALNIETALSEAGFDVLETVDTEADAVAAMERLRPDLIILDITLREGSGISAAKAIKRISAIPSSSFPGTAILRRLRRRPTSSPRHSSESHLSRKVLRPL